MLRRRAAFTLLEVLLVIVMLGVLAALTWPDLAGLTRTERLDESARRLKTTVAMARAEAMSQSRRFRLSLRQDGTVRLTRQLDPLKSPQTFVRVREAWARVPLTLEGAWIEGVLDLPSGPPPINVEDELIEFAEFLEVPVKVADLPSPLEINFEPDGTSNSARWVLRDALGRGLQMTLDGRLGRVIVEEVERIDPDQIERPPKIEEDLAALDAEEQRLYAELEK